MPDPTARTRSWRWQIPLGITIAIGILAMSLLREHRLSTIVETPVFLAGVLIAWRGWLNRITHRNAAGYPTIPLYMTNVIGLVVLAILLGVAPTIIIMMMPSTEAAEYAIIAVLVMGAIITLFGAAIAFRNGRRRYRAAHSLCLNCAHQLLSYVETCPECGTPVDAAHHRRLRDQHDDVVQPGQPDPADTPQDPR